ncbi:MAG: thermonuclease family protein [Pseudomonadota bacterium]
MSMMAAIFLAAMPICAAGPRINCVVDGDTVWLGGEKIRLAGIDAPEVHDPKCGRTELDLGYAATARLAELLSAEPIVIYRIGTDRYGRTLADITAGGHDVGTLLVAEGMARNWPDGPRFWCRAGPKG